PFPALAPRTPQGDPVEDEPTPWSAMPLAFEVVTSSPFGALPLRKVLRSQLLVTPSSRLKPGLPVQPLEPDACSASTEASAATVQHATASASARRVFREWNMVSPFTEALPHVGAPMGRATHTGGLSSLPGEADGAVVQSARVASRTRGTSMSLRRHAVAVVAVLFAAFGLAPSALADTVFALAHPAGGGN